MKHNILFFINLIFTSLCGNILNAQEKDSMQISWTLEDCINHALENNIELKSERLSINESSISLSDSKWAFAPNLSTNIVYNISIGRVLDETTYEFLTNEVVESLNSSVSVNMLLFNGLKNLRKLQYSKLNKEAAKLKYKKEENNLYLNITAYFLETLCAKENIKNCRSITESMKRQEAQISDKVKHGKVTVADLLQIQSKLADTENTLLSAEHSYDLSRMNLCQLLEIKDYKTFIPYINPSDSAEYVNYEYVNIIDRIELLPEIALAKKNIELSLKNIQITKAQYYPSLSLGLGYGSSFSNVRQKIIQHENNSYTYNSYPFWEQYKDNANQYISLGLSIPLFTNSTINSVKRAKIELKRNEYALYTTKKQVEKELTQVMMDAETAWKKLQGSKRFLSSAMEASRQITLKFEAGAVSVVEYNNVISSLVEAQTQFLSAKYEYIFKVKVLNLYTNIFILQ